MNRATLTFLLLIGCGGGDALYPPCGNAPDGYPQLTGAPFFSSPRISPGEPLSVMVPVNSHTRTVGVRVHPAYGGGSDIPAFPMQVPEGRDLVEYVIEDTDILDDVYVVGRIRLGGASEGVGAEYLTSEWEPEGLFRYRTPITAQCITDIRQPAVEVVSPREFEPPTDLASP